MKKFLSVILSVAILMSVQTVTFAYSDENYEYVLSMEYSEIERLKNGYLAWLNSETCALYNLNGEKISDDYDYIGAFYKDDVAMARKGGKYYVINGFGEVLSQYDKRVFDVSDMVLVNLTDENEDGRPFSYFEGEFGVYNYWGELLTVLPYDKYMPSKNSGMNLTFSGGRLMYKENDKWGALNLSFQTAIEPMYDNIYPFYTKQCGVTAARKETGYGLINADGEELTDFTYDELWYDGVLNGYKAVLGEKYTIFDKYGNIVLKDVDGFVPNVFYEDYGLIEVYIPNTREDSDEYPYLYGLIDNDGKVVVPIEHVSQFRISDGMIAAEKSYDREGYYDLNGNPVTDFKYRTASPFSEGLAFASSCIDDVWSHEVINKSGEAVFYTEGWNNGGFYGGIAENGTGTLINKKGEIVIKNDAWKQISWLNWWSYNDDGCFKVSDGERFGVVRYKGYISPWAEETIEKAETFGIIHSDKAYDYVSCIMREDFCEMIYNYLTLIPNGLSAVYAKNPFIDTDSECIAALNSLGIIKGKSETEFAPHDLLTREEAATIIFRLVKNVKTDFSQNDSYCVFDDSSEISDWADESIQAVVNSEIMNGVGDNKFAPKENYSVEQAIATLVRTYENIDFNNTEASRPENVLLFCDNDGNTILNGSDIVSCTVVKNDNSEEWHLELKLSEDGRKKFAAATKKISEYAPDENYLSILIDGNIISRPAIMGEINSETIVVTGAFDEKTADSFSDIINTGIKN